MYLSMMGPEGLKEATEMAILNANYIAKKLGPLFPVLYLSLIHISPFQMRSLGLMNETSYCSNKTCVCSPFSQDSPFA